MAEISGGEVLARCLASEGVGFVFGIPCPEIDPLLAALEGPEIRFVPGKALLKVEDLTSEVIEELESDDRRP